MWPNTSIRLTTLLAGLIISLAFPLTASASVAAQSHPNLSRGSGEDKAVDATRWDEINLFNGNLSLTIPLGQWYPLTDGFGYQLLLHYNSNVWDYNQRSSNIISASPVKYANSGFGWDLSMGRLIDPFAPNNQLRTWVYLEPDGTPRPLYHTLHADVYEAEDNVYYTRDGSYYRLSQSGPACLLEAPDGVVRTFELADGEWRLVKIADRFNNSLAISYSTLNAWTLTDNHGRTQVIHFKSDPTGAYPALVDRVVVAAFADTTATYTFNYTTGQVNRPSADNDPLTPASVNAPLLASVTAPDGSQHSFNYHSESAADSSGRVAGMQLPTMGKVEWDYQRYSFTGPSCASTLAAIYRHGVGVRRRKMLDSAGTLVGFWSFVQNVKSLNDSGRCVDEGEMTNTVVSPAGDKAVYYFATNVLGTATTRWDRSDYALPLTKDQPEAGSDRFLSRQIFDCDTSGNNCRLLQSLYVRFEQDTATDPASPAVGKTNRREVSQRTYYHDDVEGGAARYAGLERSDFDGLGHFRKVVTNGNFGNGDVREKTVDYNAAAGTYPSPDFVMPSISSAWVLNLFSRQKTLEGASAQVIEVCYDRNTGFLKRQRNLATTSATGTAGGSDVVVAYTPNSGGRVAKEQYYGGDAQTVATGNLCTLSLPATDQYQIQHAYQFGTLKTSQYHTETGAMFGHRFVDREIDKNTGLVKTSRDASGLATNYEYDGMARVTWIKPQAGHGAWTQFHRTVAAANENAKTFTYRKQNGGDALLTYKADVQDSFGRVWWEQTCIPGGTCPSRYTYRNAMGWVTHKSEYSNEGPKYTTYFDHDPFGRYRVERPADGEQHDILYDYVGARTIKKTVQSGVGYDPSTGQVYELPASSAEVYDRQGRRWKDILYQRHSNAVPEDETVYAYDVAGRLLRTLTNGAQVGSSYAYDGLGFLRRVSDLNNLPKVYQQYDALGNSRKQRHYTTDLTYVYDRAGRLIKVQDAADPSKVWKEFTYADANGANDWRAGKLWTTKRFNYMNNSNWVATVTETNTYGGKDGRLSAYQIELTDTARPGQEKFLQTYSYDDLGNITEIGYPNSVADGSGNLGRDRRLGYSYSHAKITKAEGTLNGQPETWASSISYHAHGLVKQIVHSNGVTDHVTNDPDGFIRPASVATTGVKKFDWQPDQNFYSGDFQYDGAGSLVRIGGQFFVPATNTPPPPGPDPGPAPTNPCQTLGTDPFGQTFAFGNNGMCSPSTYLYYTAGDRQVKVEHVLTNRRTWFFTDPFGLLLTEYTRVNDSGAWVSTRDFIYINGLKLAADERSQAAPFVNTSHYHQGFGASGITTDANGNRVEN
jgi:hypothetical protein